MTLVSLLRRTLTTAGATSLALAIALPAGATATTGWGVSTTIGPAVGVWADNFAASGADDAWSTWTACLAISCTGKTLAYYVQHWDGTAWSQVPVPSSLEADARNSLGLGASSGSDAWLFGKNNALRWNGTAWTLQALPKWVIYGNLSGGFAVTPAVFGPDSAWVFSLGADSTTKPDHYASRYNGTTWSKVTLPGIPGDVRALSAHDIWALGITLGSVGQQNPVNILMHWDGKTWSTVTLPKVTPPKGAVEYPQALTALGPSDAWLLWQIQQGAQGARTKYLLHWNGTSWARVSLKLPTSVMNFMAPDGHGGLWAEDNGPAPGYQWYLDHFSRGKWTRDDVPVASGLTLLDLTGISGIPGTKGVWATGNMANGPSGNKIYGAILRYTP